MLAIILSIEMFIILITGLSLFFINEIKKRKKIIFWTIFSAFIINTFSLFLALLSNLQFYETYLIIDGYVLFMLELILVGGIFYATIYKNYDKKSANVPIRDGISLLILVGIMGIVSSSHLLTLISLLAFVLVLFCINLFYEEIPIDVKKNIAFFSSIGISLILLSIFSIIILLDTGTIYIVEILNVGVSNEFYFIYIILIIFGFGIPCGIFPFGVLQLKRIFQDGSYYNLLFYFMINYSIIFILFKLLQIFEFLSLGFGLIITILSILGIITFFYSLLKELFFSLEEHSFSLKKVLGYSMIGDFNNMLMLISISLLVPVHLNGLFLIFSLYILVKMTMLFVLHPAILKHENGPMIFEKNKIYSRFLRYLLYLVGVILVFPLSFYSFWMLFDVLNTPEVKSSAAFTFFIVFIIIIYLLYIIITLITISTINLESYDNKILKSEIKESQLAGINVESKIVIYFTLILYLLINCLFFLNIFP